MDSEDSSCASVISGIPDIEGIVKPIDGLQQYEIAFKIIQEMISEKITNIDDMMEFLKLMRRKYHKQFSNPQLLYAYKVYCHQNDIAFDNDLASLLQKKTSRDASGVIVIAIVTSPNPNGQKFTCQNDCYYCPNEPGQPRSYLKKEPGVLRANRMNFDALAQFRNRADSYIATGHIVDKIEIIILGGTWSSYPVEYQEEFIRDIYYAANTYMDKNFDTNPREKLGIIEERKLNENSLCHIIGMSVETRPDRINMNELMRYRRYGVTRVQIGIQMLNDRFMQRVNRQCSVEQVRRAIKLLKDMCFKIDGHMMLNLPQPLKAGVHPRNPVFSLDDIDTSVDVVEADKQSMDLSVDHPDFQLDDMKVYPTMITQYTRIKDEFERGVYKPYSDEVLLDVIMYFLKKVKPWTRINRIIRDIPVKDYVVGGAMNGHMRQDIDRILKEKGIKCMDIRYREVKKKSVDSNMAVLMERTYESSGGDEYFLSYETEDEKHLFGFLRLRISPMSGKYLIAGTPKVGFPELVDTAMIRELHVYGKVAQVTTVTEVSDKTVKQHRGFGTRLIERAIQIAQQKGFHRIAVISGDGVKNYYRKFNFEDDGNFMIKHI